MAEVYTWPALRDELRERGEYLPLHVSGHVGRDEAMIDTHPVFGRQAVYIHPFMLLELRHRHEPSAWLDAVLGRVASRATERADAAYTRLVRDGADDREEIARARMRRRLTELAELQAEVDRIRAAHLKTDAGIAALKGTIAP